MAQSSDLQTLKNLPKVKFWGEGLDQLYTIKAFKGKFVITSDGQVIAKLVPTAEYGNVELFHNTMLKELAIKDPESKVMKGAIKGGGKIEIELVDDYIECKFYGKSSVYGNYDPNAINLAIIESAIEATFHVGMMPVLVVPNFEAEI